MSMRHGYPVSRDNDVDEFLAGCWWQAAIACTVILIGWIIAGVHP